MSVHLSSLVWKCPLPDASTKLVALKLADCANDDGVCWPSLQRIAAETGLSRSTVCEKMVWLEAAKMVQRSGGKGTGGRTKTTHYLLNVRVLEQSAKQTVSRQTVRGADSNGAESIRQADGLEGGTVLPPDGIASGNSPLGERNSPPAGQKQSATRTRIIIEPSVPTNGAAVAARRRECFAALVTVNGSRLDQLSKSERGRIGTALSNILAASPEVTAAEILRRAEGYRELMPRAMLTATALAAHWSRLSSSSEPVPEKNRAGVLAAGEEPEFDWRTLFRDRYDMDPPVSWNRVHPDMQRELAAGAAKLQAPNSKLQKSEEGAA